jgi:DNA topoisomerase-6 subunit B
MDDLTRSARMAARSAVAPNADMTHEQMTLGFDAGQMAPAAVGADAMRAPAASAIVPAANSAEPGESQEGTEPLSKSTAARKPPARKATAESMAGAQREISISEFFAKNRHLLGFDNKRKALLTTVKEAVDNSLDACEEAGILPDIDIKLIPAGEERFAVRVRDNGPGIVKAQIPNIFGKLLYGSKFHRLKMSRGQQGIGISAAGMYGLLTTGKSVRITSRTGPKKTAHYYEVQIDTKKNEPTIVVDREVEVEWEHGTEIEIELAASYNKGRQSVDEYVELTAIANPHAHITYRPPIVGEMVDQPRASDDLPAETHEIKPHPYGIELGLLIKMLHDTKARWLSGFLSSEFCRVSAKTADEVCKRAKLNPRAQPRRIARQEAETLFNALQQTKLMAPPTNCLAPIGPRDLLNGLLKGVKAEFYAASTREPAVYRGNPFQIEVAIAFGGQLGPMPGEEDGQEEEVKFSLKRGKKVNGKTKASGPSPARIIRFANRVPLLYQQSACSIFKSVCDTDWRRYGLSQPGNGAPQGPLVVMVHMASVWVPFTSESKEAIADYDEIRFEIRKSLQDCGRKLQAYLNRRNKQKYEGQRRDIFTRYIGEVVNACGALADVDKKALFANLEAVAQRVTEQADEVLDEDGKVIPGGAKATGNNGRGGKAARNTAKSAKPSSPATEYGENTVVVEASD